MEEIKGNGKKGKILVISDLVTPTGFSRVAHSLIRYWEKDYDIVGVVVNYHGDPHDYKFPIFPANLACSVYGETRVCDLININNFDLIWILNDAWVVNKYLSRLRTTLRKLFLPLWFIFL